MLKYTLLKRVIALRRGRKVLITISILETHKICLSSWLPWKTCKFRLPCFTSGSGHECVYESQKKIIYRDAKLSMGKMGSPIFLLPKRWRAFSSYTQDKLGLNSPEKNCLFWNPPNKQVAGVLTLPTCNKEDGISRKEEKLFPPPRRIRQGLLRARFLVVVNFSLQSAAAFTFILGERGAQACDCV